MKIRIKIPGKYRIGGVNRVCQVGEVLDVTHREGHALAILGGMAEEIKPVRKVKRVERKRNEE